MGKGMKIVKSQKYQHLLECSDDQNSGQRSQITSCSTDYSSNKGKVSVEKLMEDIKLVCTVGTEQLFEPRDRFFLRKLYWKIWTTRISIECSK